MTEILENTLIGERYRLHSVIGRGGQATVFRAVDTEQNERVVAIKVVDWTNSEDGETTLRRLTAEYAVLRKLSHPNVVKVHDAGRIGEHRCFIVMDLIDGQSLEVRLLDPTLLPLPEILRILREVAAGLDAAHKANIIHRDLKPGNILLKSDGGIVIVDFGLSRDMRDGITLTEAGNTVGSSLYMAPEQLTRSRKLDARVDVYALGIVAYEMAARQTPFNGGGHQAIAMQHLTQELPPIESKGQKIPKWFQRFVEFCTEKKPERRMQSMEEVMFTLDEHLERLADRQDGKLANRSILARFAERLLGHH